MFHSTSPTVDTECSSTKLAQFPYYLPAGRWTNLLTGQAQQGPGWHRERHDFLSLPLMVRPGTVLPLGGVDDRPDYDYADGVTFRVYELTDGDELLAPYRHRNVQRPCD